VKVRLADGRNHHDLVNGGALFEAPDGVKEQRDARHFAKLLKPFAPGARAPPGGDYDGNIHNDERGMMNDELKAEAIFLLFIIPRSSFII
jgi:hypothetical protein